MDGKPRLVWLALLALVVTPWVQADPQVRVVGLFPNAAVVNIDGERHMLRVGRPGPAGVELVAADSNTATLRINGQVRQLGLQREYTEGFTAPERQQVVIARGQGGHYRTTGSINGRVVQFMVDTGATSIAMSSVEAQRIGVDYRLQGTQTMVNTASAQVPAYRVRLDRVKVGDIELTGVEALVLEGRFPQEILLGNSYLSRVSMRDENGTLLLERRF